MKLHQSLTRWGGLATLTLAGIIALLAFKNSPQQKPAIANQAQDTIPAKRNKITREDVNDRRDLDKELRQLDNAQENIDRLKEKDWKEIERTVEESIRNIDLEKIQQQVEQAVRLVDYEKINRTVQEALQKIDFDKIQRDIDRSLAEVKNVDKEEIRQEIEKARLQVKEAMEKEEWKEDMKKTQKHSKEEVKKELENAKKELARVKEDMKHQKMDFKKELDKAKVDIDKTRTALKDYQEMIYDMEKEGLLNTKEDYTIEYKDGDLFINDKKQSSDITGKYKKYFKQKKIAIKKVDGEMKIDHLKISDTHLD
jgi:hypothetical protein